MRKLTSLLPAIVWALAVILTAFVFKGTTIALPMVAGMTGIAFILILPRSRKSC